MTVAWINSNSDGLYAATLGTTYFLHFVRMKRATLVLTGVRWVMGAILGSHGKRGAGLTWGRKEESDRGIVLVDMCHCRGSSKRINREEIDDKTKR